MVDQNSFGELNTTDPTFTFNYTYCGPNYEEFWETNFPEENVLVVNLIICLYGIFTNALCLIVFSRKTMISPTNFILSGISFSDLIVMASFIPVYLTRMEYFRMNYPHVESMAYIVYWNILQVFHAVSVWLTILLGIFRFVAVLHPFQSLKMLTMQRTKIAISIIFITVLIMNIPTLLSKTIQKVNPRTNCRDDVYCPPESKYHVVYSDFATSHRHFLRKFNFWYQGLCSRILPCIILIYVSFRLIATIMKSGQGRKKLTQHQSTSSTKAEGITPTGNGTKKDSCKIRRVFNRGGQECECQFDKTTKMLTVVLMIFLITEFPPGLVFTLISIRSSEYAHECIQPIRFLLLTLILLSGALNFAVYFTMSVNFRETLNNILHRRGGRRGSDATKVTMDSSRDRENSGGSNTSIKTMSV